MPQRRLAAIVSGDVAGYARLMGRNEEAAVRLVTRYREEIELLVHQHRGRLVDFHGDDFLAEFSSSLAAIECALEIQSVLRARNASQPDDQRMEFRLGVHQGEVRFEGKRVFGTSVNVAARLQALAEPGGICLSGAVREEIGARIELAVDDLGNREVKNVPDPVRVYRVRTGAPGPISNTAARDLSDILTRPGIAVLPFDNLSGDPEQEYFADGITEDLITQLSLCRSFPVIAHNSSFVYRNRAVDVREVSRELGARYVVQGSVRKVGGRVRVSAHLIDAPSGQHVWAQHYDRELGDMFALQDELGAGIAAVIHPEIEQAELDRVRRGDPSNPSAWEAIVRGRWHLYSVDKNLARAREHFERAIEIDPYAVAAHHGLVVSHYNDLIDETSPDSERSVAEIVRAAARCVALDNQNALSQLALAIAHSVTGKPQEMLEAAESAIRLNPSESRAHHFLGIALFMNGRYDEAIGRFERGTSLNPRESWIFDHNIAVAHFGAGRYELAVEWARRSIQCRAEGVVAWHFLASSLGQLGRLDEAGAAIREASRLSPPRSSKSSTPGVFRALSAADPGLLERYKAGLRLARGKEEAR